jgi:hypothetical protein
MSLPEMIIAGAKIEVLLCEEELATKWYSLISLYPSSAMDVPIFDVSTLTLCRVSSLLA